MKFDIETDNYCTVYDSNCCKEFTLILDSIHYEIGFIEKTKPNEYTVTISDKEFKLDKP